MVFTICELSQRLTNGYSDVNDMIVQFEWYLFPYEIRRILPVILNAVQQPVEFECFGSVACSRESFRKVSPSKENIRIRFQNISKIENLIERLNFSGYEKWILIFYGAPGIQQLKSFNNETSEKLIVDFFVPYEKFRSIGNEN